MFSKVIVVSAGQNNHGDSPEEIAEGIKEICGVIRSKQPQAFLVLLVSVFISVIIIIIIRGDFLRSGPNKKNDGKSKYYSNKSFDL